MNSLPPYFNTGIFNSSAFYTEKDYLSKEEADKLYLSIGSGSNLYLTGITPGLVLGEKCVIPDINKDISGFLNLSATSSISVNRITNGECFIASNSTVRSAIHCLAGSCHIGTTTYHNFNIQANSNNVLQCLSTGYVNIINGLQLNGTLINSTATEINYLSGVTLGTISSSKAITTDSNNNINSVLRLKKSISAQQIYFENGTSTGTIYHTLNSSLYFGTISDNEIIFQTNNQPRVYITNTGLMNIFGGWQISGTTVTSSATELNYLDLSTAGTAEASKALVLDSNRDITNIRRMTLNGESDVITITNNTTTARLSLRFTGTTSWELGSRNSALTLPNTFYLYDVSANAMRLLVNNQGSIDITSHNSSTIGLQLAGQLVTASATELNYNDITTIGSAQANKTLVCDNNRDIININRLKASYIQLGDSTDTTRFISALDNTMTAGTSKYIAWGKSNDNGNQAEIAFSYAGNNDNDNALTFGFYGGEKMRLVKGGGLAINTTTTSYGGYISRLSIQTDGSVSYGMTMRNTNTASQRLYRFEDSVGVERGSISFSSSGTNFTTTSDYRLKENITPLSDGLLKISLLKPVRYKWKESEDYGEGFIAHELQEVLPLCVIGKKDEISPIDNSIIPQSVDYARLSPILVTAVQELININKNLENRIKKLEDFISELDIVE
jgi:hypothetical protein